MEEALMDIDGEVRALRNRRERLERVYEWVSEEYPELLDVEAERVDWTTPNILAFSKKYTDPSTLIEVLQGIGDIEWFMGSNAVVTVRGGDIHLTIYIHT
jgi:hypothetical protein